MIFSRNKDTDWLDLYKRRRRALTRILWCEKPNAKLLENGARLLLEAHYVGPWRMLWALFVYEFKLSWTFHVWRRSEWLKVRLGLRPDQVIADYNRVCQEEEAVEELVRQL